MAWYCVRCQRKIYPPKEDSHRYVMEWHYFKRRNEVFCEIRRLREVRKNANIMHVRCEKPQQADWLPLLRKKLGFPKDGYHPLLV